MPIYEYRCHACRRRVQVFFRSFSSVTEGATCPHCQSTDLERIPSRVAQVRSESSYEELLTDPSSLENLDYEDPKAVAQWARRMGEAAGVDMDSDYEEMLEHMERGDDPGNLVGAGTDDLDFSDSDL